MIKCAVLVISDRCFSGEKEDKSGKIIIELLGPDYEVVSYEIIPDDRKKIKERLLHYADELSLHLVFTTGGTGLGPRDVTPEATLEVMQRPVPGLAELMRSHGFARTKKAALSRGVCVIRGKSLIINLPGSSRGVSESLEAVMEVVPHAIETLLGGMHKDQDMTV